MKKVYTSLFTKCTTQLISFLILFIGIGNLSAQTELISESFNDCEQPIGWSTTIVGGIFNWQFGYIDNNNAWASNSMNGSCFAFFDDETNGGNILPSIVRLTSPIIDGAAFAEYELEFDVVFRKQEDLEHFSVFVFDGTTHHLVEEYYEAVGGEQFNNFQTVNIDISPFRNESIQIVFHYDDGGDEGWWLGLDNIKVYGSGTLNDLCSNALDINIGEVCQPANNSTAIFTGAAPSCVDRNTGSLWYRFNSPISGILKLETAANFNDLITVFQGSCAGMSEVACFNRDEHGFIGETAYLNVNTGTDYLIRVSGIDSKFGLKKGDLCLSLEEVDAFPTPPFNDLCNNSVTLTVDSTDCVIGSTINADFVGPEPSLNLKTRSDIWYSFLATAEQLTIKTAADFSDVIAVYSGSCGDLTEVAVNQFGQSLRLEALTIGETYYVQVGGFFATIEGAVCMKVETITNDVVDNDLCGDATNVTVDGPCVSGANTFANFDGPSPSCEIYPTANVWFQFTAPSTGGVQFNTGTTFPHVVSVYSGNCTNYEEILCVENPYYCNGYFVLMDLTPGETYFLQIASAENGFGYLLGDLCLSIRDVTASDVFDPLAVVVEANCIDSGVAVLNILPTGGQGAYTVEGNITGDTLLTGVDYFTVVSDSDGCQLAVTGTVECGNFPCALGAELFVEGTSCAGGGDGMAMVDVSGTGTYQINWSNGSTNAIQENLTPGVYFVTVENDGGCSETFSVAVTNPQPIIANASSTSETGQGFDDGTATANPSGGIPPYTFAWSYNGATTSSIENLPPGFYAVAIYDANNCSILETVSVGSFECLLTVDLDIQNISCAGFNDGSLSASLENGSGETYLWTNGSTASSLQGVPAGTYSVTISDDNGCQNIATGTIISPEPAVGIVETITAVDCFGDATGQAFLNVEGGTAPYSYTWPGGGNGAVQTTLLQGAYEPTFTDANGCSGSIDVLIEGPEEPLLATIANVTNSTCFGDLNGSATAFAQGGTAGYSYQWDDPENQTGSTATALPPGTFNVTVTDNNMCTSTAQATVMSPPILSISVTSVAAEIDNMANGAISIEAMGGVAPYTYSWLLGGDIISMAQNLTGLESAGNYRVLVTDANGCIFLSQGISVPNITAVTDLALAAAVDISPNPTTGKFLVAVELDNAAELGVEVFDVLGRRVHTSKLEELATWNHEVDLENAGAGVYMVRVFIGGEVVVSAVVVE